MWKSSKILKGPLDDVGIKTNCYFMVQRFFFNVGPSKHVVWENVTRADSCKNLTYYGNG